MTKFDLNIDPYYFHQAVNARRSLVVAITGGFTMVEVMIVMAVASLILIVVLVAIPNLQRFQRNNARSNDASKISARILSFMSTNPSASLPKSQSDCAVILHNSSPLSEYNFDDQLSGNTCNAGAIQVSGRFQNLTTANRFYIYPNISPPRLAPTAIENQVLLVESQLYGTSCNSTNDGVLPGNGAGSRAAALLYTLESGSGFRWACINVN